MYNTIAKEHYSNLTTFTVPWEFQIVDDFLSSDIIKVIDLKRFEESKYKILDSVRYLNNPRYKKIINLSKNYIFIEQLKEILQSKLSSIWNNNFFIYSELVRCDPYYKYNLHKDHHLKKYSIVIYLFDETGDGTTLLDKKNQYKIMWKNNRALIFNNDKHGYHLYYNSFNKFRYTLNIAFTQEKDITFRTLKNANSNRKSV